MRPFQHVLLFYLYAAGFIAAGFIAAGAKLTLKQAQVQ